MAYRRDVRAHVLRPPRHVVGDGRVGDGDDLVDVRDVALVFSRRLCDVSDDVDPLPTTHK